MSHVVKPTRKWQRHHPISVCGTLGQSASACLGYFRAGVPLMGNVGERSDGQGRHPYLSSIFRFSGSVAIIGIPV